jgi:hypothetical protein
VWEPNPEDAARFDELRQWVWNEVDIARTEANWSEERLGAILEVVSREAEASLERQFGEREPENEDEAHGMISSVEAWASVLSYATSCFYFEGPESFLRRGGFSPRDVTPKLQDAVRKFMPFLRRACQATGATSFSVSVGFPWGISVGLGWG